MPCRQVETCVFNGRFLVVNRHYFPAWENKLNPLYETLQRARWHKIYSAILSTTKQTNCKNMTKNLCNRPNPWFRFRKFTNSSFQIIHITRSNINFMITSMKFIGNRKTPMWRVKRTCIAQWMTFSYISYVGCIDGQDRERYNSHVSAALKLWKANVAHHYRQCPLLEM